MFQKLDKRIQQWLKKNNFLVPTIVQEKLIPPILEGKNVLATAPTGYGKTLAAVLPVFHLLLKENGNGIELLYITPLRSLNRDIFKRIVELGKELGIDVQIRHGDTPQNIRRKQTTKPPRVLITTPETLQAILTGKILREHLKSVKYVIVDEIHELAESKRGVQLSLALERLAFLSQREFQRIGLSATVGDVKEVSKFLVGTNRKCEIIQTKGIKEYKIEIEYPNPKEEDEKISKKLLISKFGSYCIRKISELIKNSQAVLVFTNTREAAERLSSKLREYNKSFKISVHHSSLSKDVRIKAEEEFKNGKLKALVCTSSLELGIDIGQVNLVIQYMSPRQVIKLLQRVGRSGHGVGRISRGYIFTINIDDYLEAKAIVEKINEGWMERPLIPKNSFDVLSHAIVGLCIENKDLEIGTLYKIITRAYPYKDLKFRELKRLLEFLSRINLLWERNGKLIKSRNAMKYYFENLSMIPDERSYLVIDDEFNSPVGVLHEGFVVQKGDIGAIFTMKGEPWRIIDIENEKIHVVKEMGYEGAIPSWEGELIPVPYEVAVRAAELRKKENFPELKECKENYEIPDKRNIYFESFGRYSILHLTFGSKVNETLSRILSALITSRIGTSVGVRVDPYRIIFKLPLNENPKIIIDELMKLDPKDVKGILERELVNSSLFAYKFWQVAKRFNIIGKKSKFKLGRIQKLIEIFEGTPLIKETFNELYREKLDVEKTIKIVRRIKEGKIKVKISNKSGLSPLGELALEFSEITSLSKPAEAIKEILKLIKTRLLQKRIFLICLHCKKPIGTFRVEDISENYKCPFCKAKLIGFVSSSKRLLAKKVISKKGKRRLNPEERKLFKRLEKSAELFLNYGKRACFVLSAYGIGPETGARILSRVHRNEEELIRDIIEAERTFLRTRRYWK